MEEANKWHRHGKGLMSDVEQYQLRTEGGAVTLVLTRSRGSPWVMQSEQLWSDHSLQTVAQNETSADNAQALALMKAYERLNDMIRMLPLQRRA